MLQAALRPSQEWGPLAQSNLLGWRRFKEERRLQRDKRHASSLKQFLCVLLGCESRLD